MGPETTAGESLVMPIGVIRLMRVGRALSEVVTDVVAYVGHLGCGPDRGQKLTSVRVAHVSQNGVFESWECIFSRSKADERAFALSLDEGEGH